MLAAGAAGLGELLVEAGLGPLGPVDRVFRTEEKNAAPDAVPHGSTLR